MVKPNTIFKIYFVLSFSVLLYKNYFRLVSLFNRYST